MAQFMVPLAVASAVLSVAGGISKQSAANKEARALDDQASLMEQEAQEEARIHAVRVRKFMGNQKSAFLKNGVTLDGSPLWVLEDTRSAGQAEVDSIVKQGAAKATLSRQRAEIARSEGRAALIGGFSQGFSSLATMGVNAKAAGLTPTNGAPASPVKSVASSYKKGDTFISSSGIGYIN